MLKMYGRTFPQSRQIAAYSTVPDAKLKYSGSEITMNHPFPPVLETIRIRLEDELGVRFNHVMLNRYGDGNIYIGFGLSITVTPSYADGWIVDIRTISIIW
jgi:hypothetical protein